VRAVTWHKFRDHSRNNSFHGRRRKVQQLGDLPVSAADGKEVENLEFPLAQLRRIRTDVTPWTRVQDNVPVAGCAKSVEQRWPGAVLTINPCAPAARPVATWSAWSKANSIATAGCWSTSRNREATVASSRSGSSRSRTTTSGRSNVANDKASSPVPATPTTLMSGSSSFRRTPPLRRDAYDLVGSQMSLVSQTEPVTAVLIDDHAMFRQALCRLLARDGRVRVVGVAENGQKGLDCVREERPAVVVTDLRMPGIPGAEVTRRIRKESPGAAVLVLTVSKDQGDVLDALRAGARGYILKSAVHHEVVSAILAAARRESWLSPKVAASLIDELVHLPVPDLKKPLSKDPQLTPRERAVLTHLADGMTNRQIAEALGIAETTVKTHLQHILSKLDARNRLQAAVFGMQLKMASASPDV
jgi:DNA-binding NarL/FixJ family response regulator